MSCYLGYHNNHSAVVQVVRGYRHRLGLALSLVSMEEMTGGRGLSWLELLIILIGDLFARLVSFGATTTSQSWALSLQFVAAVFLTESIVLILLRSRLERFNAERSVK